MGVRAVAALALLALAACAAAPAVVRRDAVVNITGVEMRGALK